MYTVTEQDSYVGVKMNMETRCLTVVARATVESDHGKKFYLCEKLSTGCDKGAEFKSVFHAEDYSEVAVFDWMRLEGVDAVYHTHRVTHL